VGADRNDSDITEVTAFDSTADSTLQSDQLSDSINKGGNDLGKRVFDVARLLDSLQQLNRTQGQLQATADKLRSLPSVTAADSASVSSSDQSGDGDAIEPGIAIKDEEGSVSTVPEHQIQGNGRQFSGVELSLSGLSSLSSLPVKLHPPLEKWTGKGSQLKWDSRIGLGKGSSNKDTPSITGSLDQHVTSPWDVDKASASPPVDVAQDTKRTSMSPSAVMKRKVAFDISVSSHNTSAELSDLDNSALGNPKTSRGMDGALGSPKTSRGMDGGKGNPSNSKRSGGGGTRKQRENLEDRTWFSLTSHLA
jgi:hypothetical protein